MNNEGIVLCDPRTSALFDASRFEIIENREEWASVLRKYETLDTDPDSLTQTLRDQLEKYWLKLEMQPSPIAQMRMIKTPAEIDKLWKSQEINRAVYVAIQPFLLIGVTEEAIARRIQILQLELGASGPSFPPIVAFWENSAVPHHSPTSRALQSDDIILIDMGVIYEGYCSDMTRCLMWENDDFAVYQLLQDVTNHIIAWAKPGMRMSELDTEARRMLGEYSEYFTHSLGHGVGIQIHESPRVSGKSVEILEPGMVITIEPGIYGIPTKKAQSTKQKGGSSIVIPAEAGIYREANGMDSIRQRTDRLSRPSINSGLGWNDGEVYGLRYEEMVFVDKDKLIVL